MTREAIFRFLAGLIVALYVLTKFIRPPALADIEAEFGQAAVIAVFVLYAVYGNRWAQPAAEPID